MKCACSFTPVLAIVGLIGLGVGGYNMLRTGCPLGTCQDSTDAVVTTVAASTAETAEKACPLGCSGEKPGADIKTVALTADTAAPAPCTEATECCKGKEAEDCCKSKNDGACPGTEEACGTTTEAKGQCPLSKTPASTPASDNGAN